jgi:anti-sigma regulatory factor (Ser/Thr protein kinase)
MPTVGLTFTPLPEHVRTARLVVAAVARRRGVAQEVVETIRLAVGEACIRAVNRCDQSGCTQPVAVEVLDAPGGLQVVVLDQATAGGGEDVDALPMTMVRALAHEVSLGPADGGFGSRLAMTWRA